MSEEVTLDDFSDKGDGNVRDDNSNNRKRQNFSEVPQDWSSSTIGDIIADENNAFTDGARYSLSSAEIYNEGDVRAILLEEVGEGDFKDTNPKFATEEKYEDITHRAIYPGEIVVAKMAEPVARACIVPDSYDKYLLGCADVVRIVPNSDVDDRFLMYCMNSHGVWTQAVAHLRGTGRSRINLENIAELEIPVPSIKEQRKIATVLYTVDRAIEKTEQIIEQVNTLKSGVVQQVFRDGTRNHESYQDTKSGEVPKQWELAKFEEVITETRYGTDTKSNTESEGYPTLRIPNVVNKRITVDDLKHTPLDENELERLKLRNDDILVIRTNGNPDYVGRCATFHERDEPFVFASYLIRIRVDESRVRPAYVREFLNSPRGRSEMAGWVRSSAGNYNLSVGAIEKFQIPIPSLEEQDKMVEKITEVEKTIEMNRRYRDSLQRLKRGLMQDLLSGTVRTDDTNIEVSEEIAQYG